MLHDISFTVKPGETIAIMGETGCGKTSLINLIPRFYEPTKGEVRIDDIPVQNFRLSDLRKQIGLATQDVLLYSDTIEGNIAYGDSSIDLEEVENLQNILRHLILSQRCRKDMIRWSESVA